MTTPFGPRLIGETEKTLGAVLRHLLADHDLGEAQWVALQLADALDADTTAALVAEVDDRAHYEDAAGIVDSLADRGLVKGGRLTDPARALVTAVRGEVARSTAAIWRDLPEDDVAAATRVLNEVVVRGREALSAVAS